MQQRFVRLEPARATPGHGLGLSMVRAIAEAHGADFTLKDTALVVVFERVHVVRRLRWIAAVTLDVSLA